MEIPTAVVPRYNPDWDSRRNTSIDAVEFKGKKYRSARDRVMLMALFPRSPYWTIKLRPSLTKRAVSLENNRSNLSLILSCREGRVFSSFFFKFFQARPMPPALLRKVVGSKTPSGGPSRYRVTPSGAAPLPMANTTCPTSQWRNKRRDSGPFPRTEALLGIMQCRRFELYVSEFPNMLVRIKYRQFMKMISVENFMILHSLAMEPKPSAQVNARVGQMAIQNIKFWIMGKKKK